MEYPYAEEVTMELRRTHGAVVAFVSVILACMLALGMHFETALADMADDLATAEMMSDQLGARPESDDSAMKEPKETKESKKKVDKQEGEGKEAVTPRPTKDLELQSPIDMMTRDAGDASSSANLFSTDPLSSTETTLQTESAAQPYRVVLTWGGTPDDLDSHLVGKLPNGNDFHLYFRDMSVYYDSDPFCTLDIDVTSRFGPETAIIYGTSSKPIYYYVHNYSQSPSITGSAAQVLVYKGDRLVKTYTVPQSGAGLYWNVFAVANGQIIDASSTLGTVGSITASPNTKYAGGYSGGAIESVTMSLRGTEYDLLKKEVSIDVVKKDTEFSLRTAMAQGAVAPVKYKLVQEYRDENDKKQYAEISSSTDGTFPSLRYDQFRAGRKVYLRGEDAAGKVMYAKQLTLSVKNSETEDVPTELKFSKGKLTSKLGSPFDKMSLSIGLVKAPMTIEATEDGKFTIGVNWDVTKNPSFKSFFKDLKSSASRFGNYTKRKFENDIKKNLLEKPDPKKPKGAIEPKFTVFGCLEGDFKSHKLTGMIIVDIGVESTHEWQVWAVPPVMFGTTWELGAEGTAAMGVQFANHSVSNISGSLDLAVKGSLELYLGVGYAYIGNVSLFGKADPKLEFAILPANQFGVKEFSITGSAGLKGEMFGNELFRLTLVEGTLNLYNRDTSNNLSSSTVLSANGAMEGVSSDKVYPPVPRGYLSQTSRWNGSVSPPDGLSTQSQDGLAAQSVSELQTGVYPQNSMRMVPIDNRYMLMVWLEDVGYERSAANRTRLVYSYYNVSSGEWSEPRPVQDDGTADFSPSLCSASLLNGDYGAYLVWNNATQELSDDMTLSQKAQLMDVSFAEFRTDTLSFGAVSKVSSSTNVFESNPCVSECQGQPVIGWRNNSLNDVLGTNGSNSITLLWHTQGLGGNVGNGWYSRDVASNTSMVYGMSVGSRQGQPSIAWTEGSIDETGLEYNGMLHVANNASNGSVTTVDAGNVAHPLFRPYGSTGQCLTYWKDGAIYRLDDSSDTSGLMVDGVASANYNIAGNLSSSACVSYSISDENTGIRGRMLTGGSWSDEVTFATTNEWDSIPYWDIAYLSNGPALVYSSNYGAGDEWEGSTFYMVSNLGASQDVELGEVVDADETVTPGSPYHVTFGVRNNACAPVAGFDVEILDEYEEVLQTQHVNKSLAPGATDQFDLAFSVPEDLRTRVRRFVRMGEKKVEVGFGGPEITLETSCELVDGDEFA